MQSFLLDALSPHRPEVTANLVRAIGELPSKASWRVVIKRARKERTGRQNRALFGVAYKILSAETGFTKDELHEAFCKRFFGTVQKTVFGETISTPFRTTTTDENGEDDVMPSADFVRFYEMVQNVGAEADVTIPLPDPLHSMPGYYD